MTVSVLGFGLVAPGVEQALRVRNLPQPSDARGRRLTRLELMALTAARQALPPEAAFEELALVFGTGYGDLAATTSFLESIATRGAQFGSPLAFQESVHHSPAGQMSILLKAHGPTLTVSGRELAGESALRVAIGLLETGRAETVLVVAADECTSALEAGYRAFGALATPGEQSATEFRPGEGAAALLLGTGSSPLEVESCTLTGHACPALRFASAEQMRPLLLNGTQACGSGVFVSLAAPNAALQAIESALLAELVPTPVQWVEESEWGMHPSLGLLRVVASLKRLQAMPSASVCAVHGLAMGGGQALTVLRHAGA